MKKLLIIMVLVMHADMAYALNTSQLDGIPLPTIRHEPHRPRSAADRRFDEAFLRLPRAFDWYADILREDVRSGRLRLRLR